MLRRVRGIYFFVKMTLIDIVRVRDEKLAVAELSDFGVNDAIVERHQEVYWAESIHQDAVFDVVVHQFHLPGLS